MAAHRNYTKYFDKYPSGCRSFINAVMIPDPLPAGFGCALTTLPLPENRTIFSLFTVILFCIAQKHKVKFSAGTFPE